MNSEIMESIPVMKTGQKEIFIQIFLIFILPIVLINLGIIPVQYRVLILVAIVTALVVLLLKEKWTWHTLGIGNKTFKKYFLPYLLFTAISVVCVSFFSEKIGQEEIARWWTYKHFMYGFFVVSLFQEVAYRAYLIPALAKLTSRPVIILLSNTLLFTFLHTIFPNPVFGLPLAFAGGIGFALMYMRFPNLPLIVLSHAVLNFTVVLYGFFVIPGVTH